MKDKEYLQSVIQRRIDNLPSTYEGLYIEGSRDAYELVLQDIDELDESEVKQIRELETLTVPTDLGEWLHYRRIGDSGAYFTMIDELYHYWESVISSPIGSFITDNKKELIEVIIGNRGYRIEAPLYCALIKGHELLDSDRFYWIYDKSDESVFVSKLYSLHGDFSTEMSKEEWNELGINDTNAEFVRLDGVEE